MTCKDRGLFQIWAVSKDDDSIVYDKCVVADGEKEALWLSDLKDVLKTQKMTRDDVHLIVREMGTLPAKEEVKKVKVIGQVGRTMLAREKK